MKKFLSYLLIFVMTVAVSATITIRVKSNLLQNSQPTISASANSETTLLGGVMENLEKNSKLNATGNIDIAIGEEKIGVELDLDLDLTVLTEPAIDGRLAITYLGESTDVYLSFVNNTIFVSCEDIQIKSTISGITEVVEIVKNLIPQSTEQSDSAFSALGEKFAGISLESLMDALNNPKKSQLGEFTSYEITLDGICDVSLVCNDNFDIKTATISNFSLIDGVLVDANIAINADQNIVVAEPDGSHLDVAEVIKDLDSFVTNRYFDATIWASLYKDSKFLEYAKANIKVDAQTLEVDCSADINGLVDGTVSAKYLGETVYAKFNDIGLKADKACIEEIIELISSKISLELPELDINVTQILDYLKQNYKTLLSNVTVSSSKIKLVTDLSFLNENLGNTIIVLNVSQNKIRSIDFNMNFMQGYKLILSAYVYSPSSVDFAVDQTEYFDAQTLLNLITKTNFAQFSIDGSIAATIGGEEFAFDVDAKCNIDSKTFAVGVSNLFDMSANITYANDKLFISVGDIYVSASKDYLLSMIENISLPQIEMSALTEKFENILQNYSINDILSLANISLDENNLIVDANLSLLIGKNLQIKLDASIFGSAVKLNSFEIVYENISISGSLNVKFEEQNISVQNEEEYLNIENLVSNIQSYIDAQNLALDFDISVQKLDEIIVSLSGDANVALQDKNFAANITLTNPISQNAQISYIDGNLYLNVGAQKLKLSKAALVDILSAAGVDATEYLTKFEDAINVVKTFDINSYISRLLGSIDFDKVANFDLANLDLSIVHSDAFQNVISIIKNAKVNSQIISLVGSFGDVEVDALVNLNDSLGVCATVKFGNLAVDATIEIAKKAYDYTVDDEYVDLSYGAEDVINLINFAKIGSYAGTAKVKFGEEFYQTINLSFALDIDIENMLISGSVNAEVAGINISIAITNNELYLNVYDAYIKASIEDIKQILSSELIVSMVGEDLTQKINLDNIDLQEIISKVLGFVNEKPIFTSMTKVNDKLIMTLLDKVYVTLVSSQNSINVSASYNDIVIKANISAEEVEVPSVETDKYISILDIYETATNAYNYITDGEYYFDVDVSVNDYQISGYIGFDQTGFALDLSSTVFGKDVNIKIVDKVVYVNFDGLKLKLSYVDAAEIFEKVVSEFNINLDPSIVDIVNYILTQDVTIDGIVEIAQGFGGVELDIQEILSSLQLAISSSKIDASLLGANIVASIENNHITKVSAQYENEKLSLSANISIAEKKNIAVDETYANIGDIKNVIASIADFANSKSFEGTISVNYKDIIEFVASYVINIDQDNNISAQIVANFYGLDVCITYVNDTLFVQIKNVKIKLAKDDIPALIEWINQSFDANIDVNFNEFDVSNIEEMLSKFDFAEVVLQIANSTINFAYKDLSAQIEIANQISANIEYGDLLASLTVSKGAAQIAEIDASSYLNYTALTNFVDSVMSLIKGKKFAMQATAVIHEGDIVHYTADATLQINLEDFAFNAYVNVVDKINNKTHTIKLTYTDNYWWINYNNLKVKMIDTDVNEILALVLKVLDIDPSSISFLKDASYNVDDINIENLSAIIPKINMESPLDLLKYLDDLILVENKLVADVNGSMVTTNDNATNMQVIVESNGTRLSHIITNNLYTGVTNSERLDLDISVIDFAGVDSPDAGNYIDLSGSNELIKALVNTAELNDYEVDGSVNVKGNLKVLINIPINLTDIPLNLKVKLDENRKPIIKITLGEIPYVPFVTEEKRMVYIYYQDSFVYFQTVSSSQERLLKAHIDSVMDDILYYLQFATGFTDTIMDAIRDSIEANANHQPDLGKIINSYQVVDSKNFKISLNMGEISGDSKIGDMNIDIGVVNNSSTGYKNYIGTGSMNIYMPLASVFTLTISTNTLKLINIGQEIDFTSTQNFIDSYAYAESIIATKKSNKWTTETGKTYTINFEENGGTSVSNISAAPGAAITLPTPSKTVVSGGDKIVYEFLGWWEDDAMVHTQYNESVMARKDITLYAKWGNPTHYHTIYYYVDNAKVYTKQDVEGANLLSAQNANVLLERVVEDDGHKYYQQFVCFVDNNGNEISVIGSTSQNVYAKYENTLVLNKHSIYVETGVQNADTILYAYNTENYQYLLPALSEYIENASGVTRTYQFDGWFNNPELTQELAEKMPDQDITVYAKWTCVNVVYENRLTIYDNAVVVFNELIEVGGEIIIPTTINYNETTKWYYDGAYTNEATLPSVMPQSDITLYIRNKYTLTITYVVVNGSNSTNKETITGEYYQGESISLPNQTDYVNDDGNTRNTYTFAGYSENLSVMPNTNKTIVGTWNLDVKHYYTISFDLRWYTVLGAAAGSAWKDAPSAIASIKVLEGTVIDLTQSQYQVTGVAYTTAIHTSWATKNTYKSTTWGTSAWSSYTSGGSGFKSYTVTQNQTLYACWQKV